MKIKIKIDILYLKQLIFFKSSKIKESTKKIGKLIIIQMIDNNLI